MPPRDWEGGFAHYPLPDFKWVRSYDLNCLLHFVQDPRPNWLKLDSPCWLTWLHSVLNRHESPYFCSSGEQLTHLQHTAMCSGRSCSTFCEHFSCIGNISPGTVAARSEFFEWLRVVDGKQGNKMPAVGRLAEET